MVTQNYLMLAVTIPIIATGLLIWAKLRRIVVLLEEMKGNKQGGD